MKIIVIDSVDFGTYKENIRNIIRLFFFLKDGKKIKEGYGFKLRDSPLSGQIVICPWFSRVMGTNDIEKTNIPLCGRWNCK
jgi:hypothetical protein